MADWAKAGASEVLVSQTVKDLVAGSGRAFEDRGLHELKGVPDEWRLSPWPADHFEIAQHAVNEASTS
jgi:hypothetical protein